MQYDLGLDSSLVSTQRSGGVEQEDLPHDGSSSLQMVELVGEREHFYVPNHGDSLEGVVQKLPVAKRRGKGMRYRHSTALWHLSVIVGDTVLLVALLALLSALAFHLAMKLPAVGFDWRTQNLEVVWGWLAFLSWSVAARLAQAQQLTTITNRLKSPSYALGALLLTLIFWMILVYLIMAESVTLYIRLLLLFLILAAPSLSMWRIALAEIMSLPYFRRQAVIIGVNAAGEAIALELTHAKRSGVALLGYITGGAEENLEEKGLPILGGRSMLRYLVQKGVIDIIIMAINYDVNPVLFKEVVEAAQFGIAVIPMATIYERTSGKIPVEHVGDYWYLALPLERNVSLFYLCWQKAVDIAFGLFGTLMLLLILPILAPLIYLDSPGPIFYRQERLGHQRRKFNILKFRSMYVDAEQSGHMVWATKGDSRVTRIGRFLRATHLDELPQVLNILRGQMSLIGPRPEREAFVTELEKIIPFYQCRLIVKPGLTGWA